MKIFVENVLEQWIIFNRLIDLLLIEEHFIYKYVVANYYGCVFGMQC